MFHFFLDTILTDIGTLKWAHFGRVSRIMRTEEVETYVALLIIDLPHQIESNKNRFIDRQFEFFAFDFDAFVKSNRNLLDCFLCGGFINYDFFIWVDASCLH